MRYLALELEDFGPVRGPRRLDFDPDGLNVILGPNECGKSTLALALKMLREDKHSSKKRNHSVAMRRHDEGCGGPRATLEATIGPWWVRYSKRWLVRPSTSLVMKGPESREFSSDEAHEAFEELLGEHVDLDLLHQLEMLQGGSLAAPQKLAQVSSLDRALREEARSSGGDSSSDAASAPEAALADATGEDSAALRQRILAERLRFFTETGKPKTKSPWLLAEARSKQAGEELAATRTALEAVSEDEASLRSARTRLAEAEARLPDLEAARRQAEQQRSQRESLQAKLATLDERVRRLRDAAQAREREHAERAEALAQAQAAQAALGPAKRAVEQAEEHAKQARAALDRVTRERREARAAQARAATALRAAEARLKALRAERDRAAASQRLVSQRSALRSHRALEERLRDSAAAAAALPAAEKATAALDRAQARLEASWTEIRVRSLGAETITLDGVRLSLGPDEEHRSRDPGDRSLEVPGQVRLEVTGAETPEDAKRAQSEAEGALRAALERGGVAELSALREAAADHRRAQEALLEADEGAQGGLPSVEGKPGQLHRRALEAEIAEAEKSLAQAESLRSGEDHRGDGDGDGEGLGEGEDPQAAAGALTAAEAEAACEAAQSQLATLTDEAEALEGRLEVAAQVDTAARESLIEARALARNGSEQAASSRQRLEALGLSLDAAAKAPEAPATTAPTLPSAEAAEAPAPSAPPSADQEEAAAELREALQAQGAARQEWQALRATDLDARLRSLDTRLQSARAERDQARGDAALAQGKLEAPGRLEGFGALNVAEAEAHRSAVALERLERDARAIERLHQTLEKHRKAREQRYRAPLAEALEPLGSHVFGPGFRLHFDEDLRVEAREWSGRVQPIEHLSTGAREQIGILVRLAMAQLVAERDHGVPVFLDDVLGFADPERRERVSELFSRLEGRVQSFLLTADPVRAEALPYRKILRIEAAGLRHTE